MSDPIPIEIILDGPDLDPEAEGFSLGILDIGRDFVKGSIECQQVYGRDGDEYAYRARQGLLASELS